MESQRIGDRQEVGKWVRADLLELADVVVERLRRGHQRPELADALALHEQHARAVRSEQELVEARSVVSAVELVMLEVEVRERVRAVDEQRNAARVSER